MRSCIFSEYFQNVALSLSSQPHLQGSQMRLQGLQQAAGSLKDVDKSVSSNNNREEQQQQKKSRLLWTVSESGEKGKGLSLFLHLLFTSNRSNKKPYFCQVRNITLLDAYALGKDKIIQKSCKIKRFNYILSGPKKSCYLN